MTDPDFESFLAEESVKQYEADLENRIREQVNTALFSNLSDLGIPILLDPDEQEQQRRKIEFMENASLGIRTEILAEEPEAEMLPNFDDYVALEIEHAHHQRFWDEKVLFELVSSTLTHIERAKQDGVTIDYSDSKKKCIAEVMVMHNFSLDEPLMQWANSVLPGEPLDPNNEEDAQHIANAMEAYLKQQTDKNTMSEAMNDGYVLAGVGLHEDEDTDEELYRQLEKSRDAVAQIIGVGWTAQQNVGNLGVERVKAQRDEEIHAYIRANETGLSAEIVAELFALIDSRFPLKD